MAVCPKCNGVYSNEASHCPNDGASLVPDETRTDLIDPDLPAGTQVGEYVVERKIGSGTFGSVYCGVQPVIEKKVAIKVLSRKYSVDPDIVSRFVAEARAVNKIRHKHIIDIFSFGKLEDGRHYHVMELLEGRAFDEYLRERGGRLSIPEAIPILRALGRALDAAHAAGIAHRDFKPANVYLALDDEGVVFPKLLDFGIAKLMHDEIPRQHQTATGAAVGTPDYMSPEQCQGPNIDHRTDIYSFGIMTYRLISGNLPFKGSNVVELLMKQITAQPEAPSTMAPDLPQELDAPVLAMLSKDPNERPQTLREAVRSLEEAAHEAGIELSASTDPSLPVPISTPQRPAALDEPGIATLPVGEASLPRKRPMLAVVSLVAGVGLLGVVVTQLETAENPTEAPPVTKTIPKKKAPIPKPKQPDAMITLVVNAPENAKILGPGGVELGRKIELPRSSTPITLTVTKEGHHPATREITPLASGTISVSLEKLKKKRKKRRKKKKLKPNEKPPGKDDIEEPQWR